jgi:hypothetical protein
MSEILRISTNRRQVTGCGSLLSAYSIARVGTGASAHQLSIAANVFRQASVDGGDGADYSGLICTRTGLE